MSGTSSFTRKENGELPLKDLWRPIHKWVTLSAVMKFKNMTELQFTLPAELLNVNQFFGKQKTFKKVFPPCTVNLIVYLLYH